MYVKNNLTLIFRFLKHSECSFSVIKINVWNIIFLYKRDNVTKTHILNPAFLSHVSQLRSYCNLNLHVWQPKQKLISVFLLMSHKTIKTNNIVKDNEVWILTLPSIRYITPFETHNSKRDQKIWVYNFLRKLYRHWRIIYFLQ